MNVHDEWHDAVTRSAGEDHPERTHYADDETLAHIAELEAKVTALEQERNAKEEMRASLAKRHREITRRCDALSGATPETREGAGSLSALRAVEGYVERLRAAIAALEQENAKLRECLTDFYRNENEAYRAGAHA